MSYKFIIDTNVLDKESVNRLEHAGLSAACSKGRFAFYFTPVLLKERLDFLLKGTIPKAAKEPIKFLVSLRWQRLFNDLNGPEGIYTSELEGKLPSEYLFISYSQIKQNIELVLNGGQLIKEAKDEVQRDKDRWLHKEQQNCITYRKWRKQINDYLRKKPPLRRKGSKFLDFRNSNFEKTAINKIKTSINSKISKELLVVYWQKNTERCPHFNKFVEGQLYQAWYAMAMEAEPRLRPNDYEDIEHLVYLNNVNGIVSNEQMFMKKASQELFPDKDFMTVDQFIDKLRNLNARYKDT